MNFEVSVTDAGTLLTFGCYAIYLDSLKVLLDQHSKQASKAQYICNKYHIGRLGDLVIEECLNELELRLYAESKMLNGI